MKKLLIILGIVVILAGLVGVGYWYWQIKPQVVVLPLQTVALDNPDIKGFNEVCKDIGNAQVGCTGNINQFGCDRFRNVNSTTADLVPAYPMLICEKRYNRSENYIYLTGSDAISDPEPLEVVDYIIINGANFELVNSVDQIRKLVQPIDSKAEAKAYFIALHQGVLVLDSQTLEGLTKGSLEHYLVSPETFQLNSISEDSDGFIISAYSQYNLQCKTDLYSYSFLLKRDGDLIKLNQTLLWQDKGGYCLS